MSTLVIAEHDNATLKPATLCTVAAALHCGGDIHVLVAGSNVAAVAEQASRISGVAKVLYVDGPQFGHGLAENVALQVVAFGPKFSHILFAATSHGKNIAPRVAAKLDVAAVSDVIAFITPDTFQRPIYAGNAIATVLCEEPVKVLSVRATAFEPVSYDEAICAPIEGVEAIGDSGKSAFVSQEIAQSSRPELTSAKIIVSGGRAMGSSDKFSEVLTPLADRLGAALGASRAAVDAGYAPNDWQVGQTGKIVAPQLYIACGISGAIQHLAGMKDSKVIVAINKDPEAPIFSIADYGLEADLFEAVPQLTSALT